MLKYSKLIFLFCFFLGAKNTIVIITCALFGLSLSATLTGIIPPFTEDIARAVNVSSHFPLPFVRRSHSKYRVVTLQGLEASHRFRGHVFPPKSQALILGHILKNAGTRPQN